jgi:hypothetical protein
MATIDEKISSTISDHALRMLGCFVSGLDTVVYKMAEDIARQRNVGGQQEAIVAIEAEDVRQAAEVLTAGIRELANDGHLPPEASALIDAMVQCCQRQATESE